MNTGNKIFFSLIFIVAFLISACHSSKHNKNGVEEAMKYYDHLIMKVDADSIALLYTEDGNLGDRATGRDSIRKFLSSFKNIKVLSQTSISKSIEMQGDSAIQKGTYHQVAVISGKDTVTVNGEFTAHWQWIANDGWHIKKMATRSVNL